MRIFSILVALLLTNQVMAQGFVEGDHYEISTYLGQVTLFCFGQGGNRTVFYSCAQERVFPDAFARFAPGERVDADEVRLTAVHESGQQREQTRAFQSRSQESRSFNLLVRTLFQRPLLGLGDNRIDYELTRRGVMVAFGEFDVRVERDPVTRQCRPLSFSTNDPNLCQNQFNACDMYFRQVGSCR